MDKITRTIAVKDFLTGYNADQEIFTKLPEFSFLRPIAQKAHKNNCTCGMGQEIARATAVFNDFVLGLSPETVATLKQVFNIQSELCFGLVTSSGDFNIKCYP